MEVCLQLQQPFVVDNTNPTKDERARYIQLAKQYKFKTTCYYFQSKLNEAMERNSQRQGKENISDAGIRSTFSKLELPTFEEGFDEMYYVGIGEGFTVKPWNNEI